jgi:hypothetical protein
MKKISLCAFDSTNEESNKNFEELMIDFDQDFSDVFPSPLALQVWLQNFLGVIWKSYKVKEAINKRSSSSTSSKSYFENGKF